MDIFFEFEGKCYRVPFCAYELGRVVLPDGRLFEVMFDESAEVPHVRELYEIKHDYTDSAPRAVACIKHASLAMEV